MSWRLFRDEVAGGERSALDALGPARRFRSNPRGAVHVLATLNVLTYSGGTMRADHPIAWCHPLRGGRAWYTAGGHTVESYSEPTFRRHLLGGILWAAGLAKGSCRA